MAHHPGRVVLAHVLEVAVDCGDRRIGERFGHLHKNIGAGADVVRVQEADDVAAGACDALVERVVDAAVGFAHQHRELGAARFEQFDRRVARG